MGRDCIYIPMCSHYNYHNNLIFIIKEYTLLKYLALRALCLPALQCEVVVSVL